MVDQTEEAYIAATKYLNADLKPTSAATANRKKTSTTLSRVSSARQMLSSALNETNRLLGGAESCHNTCSSTVNDSRPPAEKTMKELLAEQRKALRNFQSYCRVRGGN